MRRLLPGLFASPSDAPTLPPWYLGLMTAAAAALLAIGLPEGAFERPLLLLTLASVNAVSGFLRPPLAAASATTPVSYAADFTALLLLGPVEAMLVAGSRLCSFGATRTGRVALIGSLFTVASRIAAVAAAAVALQVFAADTPDLAATGLRALMAAATAHFAVTWLLASAAESFAARHGLSALWQEALPSVPSHLVGAGLAGIAAHVFEKAGYWLAPLTFAPLYLTYRTYKVYMGRIEDEQRHVQATSELHLATIEALARAIEAKEHMAQSNIRRVQSYAVGLARAVGVTEPEIQAVQTAALLHDIGKLAVPEHILSKPGPLTPEELDKIRIHPEIGAEIIAAVPFPYPVAPLILSHHERWDGKGYPRGLAGDAIPMGARILTVVDYYDAVTSERPYHKPMPRDRAVELLRSEAGRALDPRLVDRFIEILPRLIAEADADAGDGGAPLRDESAPVAGTTAAGLVPPGDGPNAFENIARAHREIYALYEIAQSLGTSLGVSDTMALIAAKLAKVIPWSACALYLPQPDGTLRCRFAAGSDAPRLLQTVLRPGEGLSGWVALNRRTLVNADPRVTFEAAGIDAATELRSALVCPLFAGDSLIGCLEVCHVDPSRYNEDHRRLIERVAEQAGAVIHNSMLFEQTQEDSLTDPLTLLPNRRSMFVHLSHELRRASRHGREVALIVMDLDGFKAINDRFGHHIGDQALRAVAHALQQELRAYDLCVRYAGDEFIVVLGDCSQESAELRRRELQDRIDQLELEARPGLVLHLAASAGASVFPHDGATFEALLAAADRRMYRDKAARRRGRTGPPDVERGWSTTAAAHGDDLPLAPG